MTRIKYLFSTPSGDMPPTENLLGTEIKTGTKISGRAPALIDYFNILSETILEQSENLFHFSGTGQKNQQSFRPNRLYITSEKCGSLYHVARACLFWRNCGQIVLAVITAFETTARKVLKRDHRNLSYLWDSRQIKLVPQPYFICDKKIGQGRNAITATISIMEWLEDFHEWHFICPIRNDSCRVVMWKPGHGTCPLPRPDQLEPRLFEKIAGILSYYFDPGDLSQICLWSNAAGDFIIRLDGCRQLSARLTTVREYQNIPEAVQGFGPAANLLVALLYLFLDITLIIRIDRTNGTGRYLFADSKFIKPAVTGFFAGLATLMKEKNLRLPVHELMHLLKDLNDRELLQVYSPLMDFHRTWGRADAHFMEIHLPRHCSELAITLKQLDDQLAATADSTSRLAA